MMSIPFFNFNLLIRMEPGSDVSIKYYLIKAAHNMEVLFMAIVAFFTPINGILITMMAFILLDTITGIWRSKKNKIPITSHGLSAIISKILLYEGAILVTYLVSIFIVEGLFERIFGIKFLITKVVSLLFISIELKSIDENYKAIRGIDLWTQFKNMVSRAKEIKDDFKNTKD